MKHRLARTILAFAISASFASCADKTTENAPSNQSRHSEIQDGIERTGEESEKPAPQVALDQDSEDLPGEMNKSYDKKDSKVAAAPKKEFAFQASGKGMGGAAIAPMRAPRTRGKIGRIGVLADTPASVSSNTESYKDYGKNPMVDTASDHLSTFAVDVDTASYAIARRKILSGSLPPQAAVRVEEFLNYFRYDFEGPKNKEPFSVHMDMAPSPFAKDKHLLRVGVQAKKLDIRDRKPVNLVFLVDVSGSMSSPDKLGLAKRSLRTLVNNLRDGDTVSLVTYAGNTRVVLEPTGMEKKAEIFSALEDLSAGGSTAMSSGMDLAYELAARNLSEKSVSRVIVLSDGDANVGKTGHQEILKTIAGKVKEGVTMSTVGFGMGNYKDQMMEQLANKGNGNYFYIDSPNQAKRVFQEQLGSALEVVAKDVKIQVDFDPKVVKRYRLVGYENRDIADNDFRNDKVDAGEIGAGHTVSAIYEVELIDQGKSPATVRLRAKKPRGSKASESAYAFDMSNSHKKFTDASSDFRFATAVMTTAEILRGSEWASKIKMAEVIEIAAAANGDDTHERNEFISLATKIKELKNRVATR